MSEKFDSGPTGSSLPDDLSKLTSRIEDMKGELANAASGGQQAFADMIKQITKEISSTLLPALESAHGGKHVAKVTAQTLAEYKTMTKAVQRYQKAVLSGNEQQVVKMREGIQTQEKAVSDYYAKLVKLVNESSKLQIDKEKEIAALRGREGDDKAKVRRNASFGVAKATISNAFSGVGTALASAAALLNVEQQYIGRAKLGGLAGSISGMPGGVAAGGTTSNSMFAGLDAGALGVVQKLKLATDALKEAPGLIHQSSTEVIGFLGQFGMTADQSMGLATRASRDANISMETLVDTLKFSAGASQESGIGIMHSVDFTLQFATALRRTGLNAKEAVAHAEQYAFAIQQAGKAQGLSMAEMRGMVGKLSSAVSGMSVEKATGLMTFMTNKVPTSLDELSKIGDPQMMGQMFSKVSGMMGPDMQMFAPGAMAQMLGMGSLGVQEAKNFKDIVTATNQSSDELAEKLKTQGFAPMEQNLRSATAALMNLQTSGSIIANVLQETVGPHIKGIGDMLRSPKVQAMMAASVGGKLGAGAGQGIGSILGMMIGAFLPGGMLVGSQLGGAIGSGLGGTGGAAYAGNAVYNRRDISFQ